MKTPQKKQSVSTQLLLEAKQLHRKYVLKLKAMKYDSRYSLELYKQIYRLHTLIMLHKEIEDYNTLAENRCKFRLSDTCRHVFENTFKHYQIHGNCCSECSAYAYNSIQY